MPSSTTRSSSFIFLVTLLGCTQTRLTRKLNPNTEWIEDLSGRLTYVFVVIMIAVLFAYTPFVGPGHAWTVTNVIHTLV